MSSAREASLQRVQTTWRAFMDAVADHVGLQGEIRAKLVEECAAELEKTQLPIWEAIFQAHALMSGPGGGAGVN